MTARTMLIARVSRTPVSGQEEWLDFAPGVNVLVGPPNAGKTKWLSVIDYVLGDTASPEDALGQDLADKYASARIHLRILDPPTVPTAIDEPPSDTTPSVGVERVHTDGSSANERSLDQAGASRATNESAGGYADGTLYVIERRWKEPGAKSKIFVDGDGLTGDAFSDFLLNALGLPILHFPKGDPYSPRALMAHVIPPRLPARTILE